MIVVADLIDKSRLRMPQVAIIFLCACVTFLDGVDIQAMSVIAPALSHQWGIGVALLGPILSATFAGIAAGALLFGYLGDRLGRKRTLLISFLLVALAALGCALAESIPALLVLRFLTGLGIGGALPNATALTAEYVPARRRTLLVSLMYCGVPLGSSIVALVAPTLIRTYGWQSVFLAGGILPLLLTGVIATALPESARFLIRKGAPASEVGKLLQRVLPDFSFSTSDRFYQPPESSGALRELFRQGRAPVTLTLWLVFFCSFFGFYLLTSWLPTIFSRNGWQPALAIRTVTVFQFGTMIGGILCGWLADRLGAYRVLGLSYLLGSLAVVAISLASGVAPTLVAIIATGLLLGGPQVAIVAVSANAYPTVARSTGVGWALGAGRLGAVLSPIVAGAALAAKWSVVQVFLLAAAPVVICGLASLGLWVLTVKASAASSPPAGIDLTQRAVGSE